MTRTAWLEEARYGMFVHLLHPPGADLCVAELKNRVLSARRLDDGTPIRFEQRKDGRLFLLGLPVPLPDPIALTIALEVEGEPEALKSQQSFWIPRQASRALDTLPRPR